MRGIEIVLKHSEFSPLSLLTSFDVERFFWHMPQEELLLRNESSDTESLLGKEMYTGKELLQLINSTGYYGVLSINLRAFPSRTPITEPMTYEQYMKSDCLFVFLVYDCYCVELYCKDDKVIEELYRQYGQKDCIETMEYKTDINDGRTLFYV